MKKITLTIIKILLTFNFKYNAFSSNNIEFSIAALQPFQVEDSQDSSIYRNSFETTLYFILGQFSEKLNKCGYVPNIKFNYFSHEDTPNLKKNALKLENESTWIILGPNKSEQFLNATKVIKSTLLIIGMANSKEVTNLKWPYFTIYPTNEKLAQITSAWVDKNEIYKGKYGIITDASCIFCEDFKESYIKYAGTPEFIYETDEQLFNTENLLKELKKHNVNSILLSTYSALAGKIISGLSKSHFSHIKFIANDGFGDDLNLAPYYSIGREQKVVSIRLGPQKPDSIKILNLENLKMSWNDKVIYPPDEAIYFKDSMNKITNLLCIHKPKKKTQFNNITKKFSSNYFKTDIGYGVFEFFDNKFKYKELIKSK